MGKKLMEIAQDLNAVFEFSPPLAGQILSWYAITEKQKQGVAS
jgi:hypothetical protein